MTLQERVQGRKIGIIGMARSGMAAARLVKRMGGIPFISDIKPDHQLADEVHEMKSHNIDYETGGHSDRVLKSDFVILSPGVSKTTPIVRKIIDNGIPVFSEIELAYWYCSGRIIAVTGSNGKTTTTSLIGAILSTAGVKNAVCGNIGYAFSDAVPDVPDDGFAVVEVSNFQLELIEDFSPHIAIILNLTPDHLDRYDGFEDYVRAKYRVAENQKPDDFLILNADDNVIDKNGITTDAKKIFFSTTRTVPAGVYQRGETLVGAVGGEEYDMIDIAKIRIPGPHNLQNAAAASLAALLVGVAPESIADALEKFPGVEHRLEDLGAIAGVKFINDSKATNVDAVCYALKSFDAPICLIAGGRDKGGDFEPIIKAGKGKIKELVLIGEAREKIFDVLGKSFPVQFADNMEEAVKKSFAASSPGDIVMLSPACASFDMFNDFEHRGREFKKAVSLLFNNHQPAEKFNNH